MEKIKDLEGPISTPLLLDSQLILVYPPNFSFFDLLMTRVGPLLSHYA